MSIFNTAVEKPITTLMIFVGIIVLGALAASNSPLTSILRWTLPIYR